MAFCSIRKLSQDFSISEKDIRKKMISSGMGRMDDRSFLPTKKALAKKIAVEKESADKKYSYYVYDRDYVKSILPKTKRDPLLFAQKYSDAATNIEFLHKRLVDKKSYFHTFKYEIEKAIEDLMAIQKSCTKVDQKRIDFNVSLLRNNKTYRNKDRSDIVY